MTISIDRVDLANLAEKLKKLLFHEKHRLGILNSINGKQLLVLTIDTKENKANIIQSELKESHYHSLTPQIPQVHWFERALKDLFGITPIGHPRLKSDFTERAFDTNAFPLRSTENFLSLTDEPLRDFDFLRVAGEGIYEIPVGPVHAGIIEPGHFRLSCLGEYIQNLELRLGYLHRGVEKRLTEIAWQKARFVVEAAASDTIAANAIAHCMAIESLFQIEITSYGQKMRVLALEIERIAMHIADIGGMAVDLGFLGISATLSRLRGNALKLAHMLSGSRFLRAYICPGGVSTTKLDNFAQIRREASKLAQEVLPIIHLFLDNASVQQRLVGIGKISLALVRDFGLVGVCGRASGLNYDVRMHFQNLHYPQNVFNIAVEQDGDAFARMKVRAKELTVSFAIVDSILDADIDKVKNNPLKLPEILPPNSVSCGIVESFRGELIHLILTNSKGEISRYVIKDPSFNNWTGMAIAVRNNLIADFPLCNKSFSLSYSGHDL
jgi:Ni,Fe-hydrogenase III large subunit